MSGFSGAISYALGEDKTSTTSATSTTSLNLTYAGGPIGVQFGYQVEDVTAPDDKKFLRLGASYNFGMATAKLIYGKAENIGNVKDADATDWMIGADFPVSAALTLSGSFAQSSDNKEAGDFTRKGFGIAAAYTLSKRTFLYGGFETNNTTKTGVPDAKTNILAVGVQHRF